MSRDPSRIFLSGASNDFKTFRAALAADLAKGICHAIHQDDFPHTSVDTVLKLAQLIEPCGILLHLVGRQPGSPANKEAVAEYLDSIGGADRFLPNHPELRAALRDFSGITYTQWEAYIALHRGLEVQVYADHTYKEDDHPQRLHLDRLLLARKHVFPYFDLPALNKAILLHLLAYFRLRFAPQDIPAALKPSNLPGGYIGRLFLGRDEFLEEIRASLHGSAQATAITQQAAAAGISGLGGIGKTHAAVEYAHRHRADYSALLFVTADSPERLQSSLAALCGVLHLDENGSLPPEELARVAAALDWLAAHPGWLLIVDNVDDEAAARALVDLLGRLATGHILITSRLRQWPDQVKNLDLEVLSDPAAAELLLRLAERRLRDPAADDAHALRLAGLLDGLPLAVHQAAGYINEQALTLADYIARYEEEAEEFLGWFSDHLIKYPRPVLVTWKTSFDKLSADDRFWLLVFSHFAPEPVPRFLLTPAADASKEDRALLRQATDAVARAGKYSLLTLSTTEPVFKLHRLVQQITRLQSGAEERHQAIGQAIALFVIAAPGNALDVRSWPKWNPLQNHAAAVCEHAPDEPAAKNLTWLLNELGNLYRAKSLHPQAELRRRRALKIDRAALGDDHPIVAIRLTNLAALLQTTNRLAEAEPLMRNALRIDRAAYGDDHPDVAIDLNNLAQLLQATHRLDEAEPLMRDALRIDRAAYGDDHPDVASDLSNLATLLLETDRPVEAEPLMRDALRIDRAAYGDDHPAVAIRLNNLAQLLQDTHRLDEAEPLMRDALRIDRAAYGDDHPAVARDLNNLARLLQDTHRLAEAEPLFRDALRIDRAVYGNHHPDVAIRLNNLARLLQDCHHHAEAEPLMREALRIAHDSLGPEHPYTRTFARSLEILLAQLAAASGAAPPPPPQASADGID